MVTDNNSAVNTFIKGLNTDASYQVIPEGQYTDANNIRIMSLTHGSVDKTNSYGEVRPIEGVYVINNFDEDKSVKKILATGYIRNLGVIIYESIVTIDNKEYDGWKVYVYDMDDPTESYVKFQTPTKPVVDKFSITLRYEDEDNVKLYIADGEHPIIILNIADDENTNLELDQVLSYPKIKFTPPIFCGYTQGRLKPALVQYSYRLYNKNSISTDVSPTTKLIPIVNTQVETGTFVEGYQEDYTSNVGIKLKFEIDQEYDYLNKILVYRITYVQNGQLPTIELICDQDLNLTQNDGTYYFEFSDVGQNALQTITLEEYNNMTGIHIIPKVIESKNDYLFAACIDSKSSQFDVDDWDATENVTYKFVKGSLDCDESMPYEEGNNSGIILTTNNNIQYLSNNKTISSTINLLDENNNIIEYTINGYDNGTNSYADPQMFYNMKSLRRGETYRYGIVLYNKLGQSSAVKWIDDITVPEIGSGDWYNTFNLEQRGDNNNIKDLKVYPIGIQFDVQNLPEDVVSYEIVRCNRSLEDIRNISQGVVSRPIARRRTGVYSNVDENQNETNTQISLETKYPYTPSGFLTTVDIAAGIIFDVSQFPSWVQQSFDFDEYNKYLAHNFDNFTVFQFVSPEVVYQKDQINNLLAKKKINLAPIKYLYALSSANYPSPHNAKIHFEEPNGGRKYSYFKCAGGDSDSFASIFYEYQSSPQAMRYALPGKVNEINTVINPDTNWYELKKYAYAYIKLYFQIAADLNSSEITSYTISQDLNWNDVISTEKNSQGKTSYIKKYEQFETPIMGGSYCNVAMYGNYNVDIDVAFYKSGEHDINRITDNASFEDGEAKDLNNSPVGLGGTCLVISTKDQMFTEYPVFDSNSLSQQAQDCALFGTYLCNIKKDAVPYGGSDISSKQTSVYYSYGNYFDAETTNPVIFDGDCFIVPFEYVSMHKYYNALEDGTGFSHCVVYSIPVESNINTYYSYGNLFSRYYKNPGISNLQIEPSNVNNVYTQDKPLYAYNTAYSSQDKTRLFAAENEDTKDSVEMNTDYRCYHSQLKTNDEHIDSWTKFMPADYIDVDTRYGEITNLRTFNNKLIFWQKDAMGLLSVNERTTITDESNLPLILGTGGILSRYDYIDETSGMMPEQYVDTYSNTTLYWYDAAHREIKAYTDGSAVVQLSKAKTVQNKLNKSTNEHPYIMFNNKYNTIIADVLENKNIVYDETLQQFISTTGILIEGSMKYNDDIYVINGNKIGLLDHSEDGYRDWNGNIISTYIEYVVNKNPLTTKVYDNQELITINNPIQYNLENPHTDDKSYYTKDHTYSWTTDLCTTTSSNLEMTIREGNYRYAIPRANNAEYGSRIRGKYMICSITDNKPHKDSSLSYVITKFRISWS